MRERESDLERDKNERGGQKEKKTHGILIANGRVLEKTFAFFSE